MAYGLGAKTGAEHYSICWDTEALRMAGSSVSQTKSGLGVGGLGFAVLGLGGLGNKGAGMAHARFYALEL